MKATTLGTVWERRTIRVARIFATVSFVLAAALAFPLLSKGVSMAVSLPAAGLVAWLVHYGMTRKIRRRRRILSEPFPIEWETVLEGDVVFFRALDAESQVRFRRELQAFIGEKRITGIKTQVDTRTRVLAAASAVIPIFGFPWWEWNQISEVLIYPGRFDQQFNIDGGDETNTLGMVGTGLMNRIMILSKPDLIRGFSDAKDKRNVGLHEFAHLVDKSDGSIDGVPGVGLDRASVGPWIELVRRKMLEIEAGESDINPYALTNEAEFFAVASEYFFERPGLMEKKHPELFAMMQRIFAQNLSERVADMRREINRGRRKFSRNSPCPCGSGVKYKKCCLRKARGG